MRAIPCTRFETLIRSKPELALRLAQLIALRRGKIESGLEVLVFHKVPGRLANLLLELGRAYGVPDSRSTLLHIRLSQQEIGNPIGASREIVSSTLSDFRRQGLVDHAGGRLIIRRPQPLAQLA